MRKVQWTCDNCGKVMLGNSTTLPPDSRWYSHTTGAKMVLDFCSKTCMGERLKKGVKRK